MSDGGQRAQRAGRQVSAEFRGEVCVVRWGSGSAGDLAGDLRAELEFCRVSGAADIVLDVDPNVTLGWEELSILQEAAGSSTATTNSPPSRWTLSAASWRTLSSSQPSVTPGSTSRTMSAAPDTRQNSLSLIHISEPTRLGMISYAV